MSKITIFIIAGISLVVLAGLGIALLRVSAFYRAPINRPCQGPKNCTNHK